MAGCEGANLPWMRALVSQCSKSCPGFLQYLHAEVPGMPSICISVGRLIFREGLASSKIALEIQASKSADSAL